MLAKAAFAGSIMVAALCGAGEAAGLPDMAEMQSRADLWLADTAGKSESQPAEIQLALLDACETGLVEIYSQNWPALTSHADDAIAALPFVPESALGEPAEVLDFAEKDADGKLDALVTKEGVLLCLRFYEPEALANNGYAMLTASTLQIEDISRNAILGNFMSSELFATERDGQPAVGLTKGLWTVVTAYERTEHGLLVPRAAASYPRLMQD